MAETDEQATPDWDAYWDGVLGGGQEPPPEMVYTDKQLQAWALSL